jgi:hypothetical protein
VRTCAVAKVWVAQPRITLVDPGYLMGGCRRLGWGAGAPAGGGGGGGGGKDGGLSQVATYRVTSNLAQK